MKVARVVYEQDYCSECNRQTNHKFSELTDGRAVVECFGCMDMVIRPPVPEVTPAAVNQ